MAMPIFVMGIVHGCGAVFGRAKVTMFGWLLRYYMWNQSTVCGSPPVKQRRTNGVKENDSVGWSDG